MKVTVEELPRITDARDMEIGQIAKIESGLTAYSGHILKTFFGFVLLENPRVTWVTLRAVLVSILSPGTKVVLEIE
jgi:hypothetical protein